MTDAITLVQCTASKREESARARNLYDESTYFCRMRDWAKARENDWAILSAKYGIVHPGREIAPYDERGLTEQQAEEIAEAIDRLGYGRVDVTAGRDYTGPLVPELERRGIDVVNHFAGQRIGTRMRDLKQAAEELRSE